jgi:hypothetical protein
MSETFVGLDVAVAGAVVRVVLGAIVMGELEDTLAVCESRAWGNGRGAVVGKEIEREFVFGELERFNEAEAEVLVVFDCEG